MNTNLQRILTVVLILGFMVAPGTVLLAAEARTEAPSTVTLAPVPIQYAFVNGDEAKFQNHEWIKGEYSAGAGDSTAEFKLPKNVTLSMDGHALVPENDFAANASLKKENLGFVNLDFTQFRRYYDTVGGVYDQFTWFRHRELDKGLHLDIGHFGVDAGLTIKNWPHLGFEYDRDYRIGNKSMITWGAVREGTLVRYINPSYKEVTQAVDTFAIKADHTIKGFFLKGDQRWEYWHGDIQRVHLLTSNTGVITQNAQIVYPQDLHTNLMTTTVQAERWFLKDKMFASSAYRYARMSAEEVESIFTTTPTGSLINGIRTYRDNTSHNTMEDNTWVENFMWTPWHSFSFIAKVKGDVYRDLGYATEPQDNTPAAVPDGNIDTVQVGQLSNKIGRMGESVSLRYTGIPRTALYSELEFDNLANRQLENKLSINGQSAAVASKHFTDLTRIDTSRQNCTIGGNFAPWYFVNTTADVRIGREDNDYDYKIASLPTAGELFRAFFDSMKIDTEEFKTRTTLRVFKWLQPAFRYQYAEKNYGVRAHMQPDYIHTHTQMNTYSFDLMYQPFSKLMTMMSFSRQTFKAETPAIDSQRTMGVPPTFNANVNMWMFTADYSLCDRLTLNGSVEFSRAPNFNDYSSVGLPLGADYNQMDLSFGLRWALNKRLTLEPKYSFYHYNPNQNVEYGKYDVHVISLEMLMPWG